MFANRNIIPALLLFIPIVIFYLGYFFSHDANLYPTGFIQYDNVGYAAYAKQYLDEPINSLFYANPYNDSSAYPKIYFQSQNFFLGLMMWIGIAPGFSICLYSIAFALLTILVIIKLYDTVFPNTPHRKISLLVLIWGGGILTVAGLIVSPFRYKKGYDFLERIFYLDPANGWWGLNLGRPLLFGVESYYHFLFFSVLLLLLKKRWIYACFLAFVLSFSHPFTGIHLLLVMFVWITIEKLIFKNKTLPWWVVLLNVILIGIHLYYYLIYMPSFPDHKNVSEQYSLNWYYRFYHFGPAYILVFSLFVISVKLQKWVSFFSYLPNRLFLCMGITSFLLSNHELFIKPMQPIHFARGYEWTAYCLLGIPALHFILTKLKGKKIALTLVTCLFLLDNFLWIVNYVRDPRNHPVTHISAEQKQILDLLSSKTNNHSLIIGRDEVIPYLTSVYTKAYTWISHPYTTTYYHEKKLAYENFLEFGKLDAKWTNKNILFVFNKQDDKEMKRFRNMPFEYFTLFRGNEYIILYPASIAKDNSTNLAPSFNIK